MVYYNDPMRVEVEDVKEEFARDTYWTRIHLSAEDGRSTFVLVCVSLEYLWNLKGTRHFDTEWLNQWMKEVGSEWQAKGDAIFSTPVHYEVYAMTSEGKVNGLEFLQTEVLTQ